MTIAELKKKSDKELDKYFSNMPEPTYKRAINTDNHSMEQIIRDFSESTVSKKDLEALQNDLINLS